MFARNYLKYQEDQSSPALGTRCWQLIGLRHLFLFFSCGGAMHTGNKGVFIMYITFFSTIYGQKNCLVFSF